MQESVLLKSDRLRFYEMLDELHGKMNCNIKFTRKLIENTDLLHDECGGMVVLFKNHIIDAFNDVGSQIGRIPVYVSMEIINCLCLIAELHGLLLLPSESLVGFYYIVSVKWV